MPPPARAELKTDAIPVAQYPPARESPRQNLKPKLVGRQAVPRHGKPTYSSARERKRPALPVEDNLVISFQVLLRIPDGVFPTFPEVLSIYDQLDGVVAQVGQEFLDFGMELHSGHRAGSQCIQDCLGEKAVRRTRADLGAKELVVGCPQLFRKAAFQARSRGLLNLLKLRAEFICHCL